MQSTSGVTVITCDLEGRVEKIENNNKQKKFLGFSNKEIINKKRIFSFFSENSVLKHIDIWRKIVTVKHASKKNTKNSKENSKENNYYSKVVLKNKNNEYIDSDICITPRYNNNKEKIGFYYNFNCKPSSFLYEYNNINPLKDFIDKWLFITRARFLLITFVPLILGIVWSLKYVSFSMMPKDILLALFVGMIFFHISTNTFNDYFDWKSGADKINYNFLMFASGGSRSLDYGLISPKSLLKFSFACFFIIFLSGMYITFIRGPIILGLGFFGAFSAYFYTAPPLRLSGRYGIGELLILLCFGPLFVFGVVHSLSASTNLSDFLIGLPIGLLITALLWVNEYPDFDSDKASGKHNLVVVLGKKNFAKGLFLIIFLAYLTVISCVACHIYPIGTCATLLSLPLAFSLAKIAFKIEQSRKNIQLASIKILQLCLLFGITLIVGCLICF